ncbi:RNA-directed DNA polymerase, eukaryota, reverse transcriptase zinc-binding domain protein [Tanacetum coccineum]
MPLADKQQDEITLDLIKSHVKYKVGNGSKVFKWYDNWSNLGPLEKIIPKKVRNEARMKDNDCVVDLIHNGEWNWPKFWFDQFPVLKSPHVPNLSHQKDSVIWVDENNKETGFSVGIAWKSLRDKWPTVNWSRVVWFSQCVPKHAFILWLAIQGKLLTQDKMLNWQNGLDLKCSLCKVCCDSHSHLFFDCAFSKSVWEKVKSKGRLRLGCSDLVNTVSKLAARKARSNIWQIVDKIILSTTVYFIWNERNKRIFKGEVRSVAQLVKSIQKCISDILLSFSVKSSGAVLMVARIWGLGLEKGRFIPLSC